MAGYNLKTENGRLSFQPKRDYKGKVILFTLVTLIIFIVTPTLNLNYETKWGIFTIGLLCGFTAAYDFLFHFNVTYIFDQTSKSIYHKIPGLYTRQIMTFEEVFILRVEEDGLLHYALSKKQNKYGKGYTISQPFGTNKKSRKRQEIFETEILSAIESFIQHLKVHTHY
jgi:hypothetical protein